MNFGNLISIFCVLLYLTYLTGCTDDNSTNSSPAPAASGMSNETNETNEANETSATSPQPEQSQSYDCDNIEVPSKDDFFAAVEESDISVVLTYLNCGGDVNVVNNDYDRNTALHLVDDVDVARILMQASADINAENGVVHGYRTPFEFQFNSSVIELLVNEGADTIDLSQIDRQKGVNPLFYARSIEVVEKLIERGADHTINDYRHRVLGQTVLHFITCNNRDDYYDNKTEILRILIDAGAEVNTESDDLINEIFQMRTPLECAESIGNEAVIRLLKEAGATE